MRPESLDDLAAELPLVVDGTQRGFIRLDAAQRSLEVEAAPGRNAQVAGTIALDGLIGTRVLPTCIAAADESTVLVGGALLDSGSLVVLALDWRSGELADALPGKTILTAEMAGTPRWPADIKRLPTTETAYAVLDAGAKEVLVFRATNASAEVVMGAPGEDRLREARHLMVLPSFTAQGDGTSSFSAYTLVAATVGAERAPLAEAFGERVRCAAVRDEGLNLEFTAWW